MMEHLDGKFLIDGRLVAAVRADIPVHNPATGDIVGTSGHATLGEVNAAVRVAKHSFESWAGRPDQAGPARTGTYHDARTGKAAQRSA
ncbi:MAG: hypothetical protein OXC53_08620 [Rhodobacteraceae bacterium]|nr:hypothetical protein [Paracoccaceae bacterium]